MLSLVLLQLDLSLQDRSFCLYAWKKKEIIIFWFSLKQDLFGNEYLDLVMSRSGNEWVYWPKLFIIIVLLGITQAKVTFLSSTKDSTKDNTKDRCLFYFKRKGYRVDTSNSITIYHIKWSTAYTLCCISLGRCCFGLETRVIIKIWTHPCYPINVDWFSLGWSKKIKMADSKKTEIFNSPNSQYFFMKILWIGAWINRINWCEGHQCGLTYMVVRLSDVSSKNG